MANSLLTTKILVKEALAQLENELVMPKLVHRDYEDDFKKNGDTIRIRRPVRYTVRTGATMSVQDTEEGSVEVVLNKQEGVDFGFSSKDLTLAVEDVSERYIKPAMMQLAHRIDSTIMGLYSSVANWVGTPGEVVNSFADYAKGPQRLDENAVPEVSRSGILSPADYWATIGSVTALQIEKKANTALERARLGMFAGTDTYKTQQVLQHVTGAKGGTPVTDTTSAAQTYATVMTTTPLQQTISVTGASNSITGWAKAGDVITIADVLDCNPASKQSLGRLKQFTVLADANSNGSGVVSLTISPAMINAGAQRNCIMTAGSGKTVTVLGSASTSYTQNLLFHKNAFALACRPLEIPSGVVDAARETYKGISARLIPVYDGTNDVAQWRFDVLYGVAPVYPELAVRLSGTA